MDNVERARELLAAATPGMEYVETFVTAAPTLLAALADEVERLREAVRPFAEFDLDLRNGSGLRREHWEAARRALEQPNHVDASATAEDARCPHKVLSFDAQGTSYCSTCGWREPDKTSGGGSIGGSNHSTRTAPAASQ